MDSSKNQDLCHRTTFMSRVLMELKLHFYASV